MAIHKLSLSLCLLLLCNGLLAHARSGRQQQESGQQNQCDLDNLNAFNPNRRFESEAGVSEFWDPNDNQLQCARVNVARYIIQPKGLLLPEYSNAPRLTFIVQGRGIFGAPFPGCPETYQSGQQTNSNQHQRIQHFLQGDVLASPAGVPHWFYNDGEEPLIMVTLLDTGNSANQLDQTLRNFHIAGNEPEESSKQFERLRGASSRSANIFAGLDVKTIARTYLVSEETARKLQWEANRKEGHIIKLEKGLDLVSPLREEGEEDRTRRSNGLEESFCYLRLRENIDNPAHADVFTPQAGRLTTLNSQKFPILRHLRLSATRTVLYPNALLSPSWVANAHSIVYVTRGNARVQIVNYRGRNIFDGQVQVGQLFVVPQEFLVAIEAGNKGFEYIAFRTNDETVLTPLAGKTSTIRAFPEEVVMYSYGVSRDEARKLKYSRDDEMVLLTPQSKSQERTSSA